MLRHIAKGTRLSRAQALKTFFVFLEMRHKVEIHQMTGRIVECPIDEMSRPPRPTTGTARHGSRWCPPTAMGWSAPSPTSVPAGPRPCATGRRWAAAGSRR